VLGVMNVFGLQVFPPSSLIVQAIGLAEEVNRVNVKMIRPAVGVPAKVLIAIQFLSRSVLPSRERIASTGGPKLAPPLIDRLTSKRSSRASNREAPAYSDR